MTSLLVGVRNALFAPESDLEKLNVTVAIPQVGSFGVIAEFNPDFYVELIEMATMQWLLSTVIAIIVYKCIVMQRGSPVSYLIGYGVVGPFLVYVPFLILQRFSYSNLAIVIALGGTQCLLFLHCMEAMHGTVPAFATESLGKFIFYMVQPVQFNFDSKTEQPIKATWEEIQHKIFKTFLLYVEISLLYSLLIPYRFEVFPARKIRAMEDLFYWGNLCNNYLLAVFASVALEIGSTTMALITSLASGISTSEIHSDPLSASSSLSEFWGQRWNQLVSRGLKRAVFKPMRKNGFPRSVSALMTFVTSALLHEYILLVMAYPKLSGMDQRDDGRETPNFGCQGIFFLWNAVVLILEQIVQGNSFVLWLRKVMPGPLRTALLLMTVLPIFHLFVNEYIRIGYFDDFLMVGFPLIKLDLERALL